MSRLVNTLSGILYKLAEAHWVNVCELLSGG
jgi:hypothetical protein